MIVLKELEVFKDFIEFFDKDSDLYYFNNHKFNEWLVSKVKFLIEENKSLSIRVKVLESIEVVK